MTATRVTTPAEVVIRKRALDDVRASARQEAYRRQRKEAYRRQLGEDATYIDVMGDVIDAVIKHIYGDPTELDAMVAKIAAIKALHPKPPL